MENGVTNLLFGKNIKFDHWGTMNIKSYATGQELQVKVHKSEGLLQSQSNRGKIEGVLSDAAKVPRYRIRGYWTGNIQFDKFNEESKQFEQPKYLFKQVSVPDEEDTEWDTNY